MCCFTLGNVGFFAFFFPVCEGVSVQGTLRPCVPAENEVANPQLQLPLLLLPVTFELLIPLPVTCVSP